MQIIEQFICGKRQDQTLCEDGLLITDHFIVVVDGVTSKGKIKYDGFSSGWKAKEVILKTIATMEPTTTKIDMFSQLDFALREHRESNKRLEWLRASIIVFSKHRNEIWSLGDCSCIINNETKTATKKIDRLLGALRAFVEECDEDGREAIKPFLEKQMLLENKWESEFGYTVANGNGFYPKHIQEYKVHPGDTVVFATDGYPQLFNTLQESEDYLQHILEVDPKCIKEFKSTKGKAPEDNSFDDRTYIRFIVQALFHANYFILSKNNIK